MIRGAEPVPQQPPAGATEPFFVDFDFRVSRLDGDVVVIVLGEIDMASGPLLWECLAGAFPDPDRRLVLDLAGTTFIDSTGLALFSRAHQRLRRGGAELVLRAPSSSARSVLRITGLDQVVTIEDGSGRDRPCSLSEPDGAPPPSVP